VSEPKKRHSNPPGCAGAYRPEDAPTDSADTVNARQAKIEIFGEEMIEKWVKASANSGRVYLPPEWVGRRVKIIRVN
jgi:putative transposon-encoded protein